MIWGYIDIHKLHPKFDIIYDNFDQIQKEFREGLDRLQWITWSDDRAHAEGSGYVPVGAPLIGLKSEFQEQLPAQKHLWDWEDGLVATDNIHLVPTLVKCLRECGITRRASITKMEPNSKIPLHRDGDPNPPDGIVMRGIMGLDVPTEEGKKCYIMIRNRPKKDWDVKTIKDRSIAVFQPNNIHGVVNQLNGVRYTLCFDTVVRFQDFPDAVKSCRTTGVWANLD